MLFQESNQATHCRVVGADISEAAKPRARGMAFPAEGRADAKALVLGGWGGERARPAAPGMARGPSAHRNQPQRGGKLGQRQVKRGNKPKEGVRSPCLTR